LGKYLPHIAWADAMVINFCIKNLSCGVVKLLSEASVKNAQKSNAIIKAKDKELS
jgi:hypothetical protein